MDVFDLQAKISLDSSGLLSGLKNSERSMKGFGDKMSNSFDKIQKAAKWLVGGYAAKQIVSFTKSALDMRGSLEQSLGGVEAVFGDYWLFVNREAQKAYENLGLSQNAYLETANRIGSLLQGSGFTAEKAAETSIQVMQRASDVASIMGIDVQDAMTAIAGAAKGNFTMMDNLGVAMNATTIEAYALEKGITKSYNSMTQAEKIGLAYDLFLEKTARYAGNYAKENDTYAGSINTLKAAWENFMTGEGTADAVVESAMRAGKTIYKNLKTLVPTLARGFGDMIKTSVKKIKWPTWGEVKQFASNAWNTIVDGVKGLATIFFDEKVVNNLKWPEWNSEKSAVENGWAIVTGAFDNLFVLAFGEKVNGNITWPEWDTEKGVLENGWAVVKGAFDNLFLLAFGEKVNGKITWPTWGAINGTMKAGWRVVEKGFNELFTLAFGEKVKDNIQWPEWDDDAGIITNGWDVVTAAFDNLMAIAFGRKVNGDIDWPSWTDIGQTITDGWDTVTGAFEEISPLLFGDKIHIPDSKEISDKINKWTGDIIQEVQLAPLQAVDAILGTNYADEVKKQQDELKALNEAITARDETTGMTWGEQHAINSKAASDAKEMAGQFAEEYQAYLDSLSPMQIPMTIEEFSLQQMEQRINEIEGPHTIRFNVAPFSGIGVPSFAVNTDGSHASGLWDVPYDDYSAILHEGEMVLTKSQANDYRKGEAPGMNSSAIVGAIQRLENTMSNLRLMVGEREFGRATVDYGGARMNRYIGGADSRLAAGYGS